jgi:hypothetical protein
MNPVVREFVRQRAGGRCEYCLLPEECDELPFHVEHVIARQHGGGNDEVNLCWSCSRCNLHKGPNIASLDPATGTIAELFNPRTQKWSDHFQLHNAVIIGLTPPGRATARVLNMNDDGRVDLRRDLMDRGIIEL